MGVWSPFWLLQLLQENGSPLDAAHLLLAPEPSGEEASHLEGSQPPGGGGFLRKSSFVQGLPVWARRKEGM